MDISNLIKEERLKQYISEIAKLKNEIEIKKGYGFNCSESIREKETRIQVIEKCVLDLNDSNPQEQY